jgi:lysine decarboxylase
MLALEHPDALVLVARNIHHSVVNALKAFGLDFRFLPAPYDAALRGGPAAERRAGHERLPRHPRRWPCIYTSPTYEGLAANTADIVEAVHAFSDSALVIVDEAWGGHLHFHPELPESAMAAGADLCVQSTHKLAGGLQQTGLIHWRTARVDSELMEEAYREYVTTSPSYHLLASCDAAVRALASDGEAALGACIERTAAFKAALRARLRELDHSTTSTGCERCGRTSPAATGSRRRSGCRASTCRATTWPRRWSSARSSIEKAGVQTLTLITTFQIATTRSTSPSTRWRRSSTGTCCRQPAPARAGNPFAALDDRPVVHPYAARRYAKAIGHEVPLRRRSATSRPRASRSTRRGSR